MSKITLALLKKIFPGTPNAKLQRFVIPFNEILPKYGITTKKRFAAFIANVAIESDRLKALEEYASGAAYEGRKNLGNVRSGDGVRFKGRSILQTTGRYNYWRVVVAYLRVITGKNWDSKLARTNFDTYLRTQEYADLLEEADKYNVNFLANPELLEVFPHAVKAACIFVADNNLNYYADNGDFFAYAGILNTGDSKKRALHYKDRLALYNLALEVIPDNFNLLLEEKELIERQTEPQITETAKVQDSNVSVETNDPTPKEKIAVVSPKPTKWYAGFGAKITSAITGNAFFIWLTDKLQALTETVTNPYFWYIVAGFIAIGTIIWLYQHYKENQRVQNKNDELVKLSIEQNSTPNNFIQTIPYDEVQLYRLRGYKIITTGESVPQPNAAQ